jgi:hypothetical protein
MASYFKSSQFSVNTQDIEVVQNSDKYKIMIFFKNTEFQENTEKQLNELRMITQDMSEKFKKQTEFGKESNRNLRNDKFNKSNKKNLYGKPHLPTISNGRKNVRA